MIKGKKSVPSKTAAGSATAVVKQQKPANDPMLMDTYVQHDETGQQIGADLDMFEAKLVAGGQAKQQAAKKKNNNNAVKAQENSSAKKHVAVVKRAPKFVPANIQQKKKAPLTEEEEERAQEIRDVANLPE